MQLDSFILILIYVVYCGAVILYSEDREEAVMRLLFSVGAGLVIMLLVQAFR